MYAVWLFKNGNSEGDEEIVGFSYLSKTNIETISTTLLLDYLYKNVEVHDILKERLLLLPPPPMFPGSWSREPGLGRLSRVLRCTNQLQNDRHQLLLNPKDGIRLKFYVNGFSTSLSEDIYYQALRKVLIWKLQMFLPAGAGWIRLFFLLHNLVSAWNSPTHFSLARSMVPPVMRLNKARPDEYQRTPGSRDLWARRAARVQASSGLMTTH